MTRTVRIVIAVVLALGLSFLGLWLYSTGRNVPFGDPRSVGVTLMFDLDAQHT